jgi:peptidoglycan/xylan/chitin deacetylase (PgdA/CDA1 family)
MIKRLILHVCKWTGFFRLSLMFTKRKLRIICYHGFAAEDEHRFRPRLFILPSTFERRMNWLAAKGFRVLPLSKALELLDRRELPAKSVVITIDDGFAGVYQRALPILKRLDYPSTTYVTTYNVLKGTPVFRLLIQYCFWKTKEDHVEIEEFGEPTIKLSLRTPAERDQASDLVVEYGESQIDEAQRVELAKRLAEKLGIEYDSIVKRRLLGLMTPEEIRSAVMSGMDVQLHTHRHRLPNFRELVAREIEENRAVLEPIVGKPLRHLCYPSGIWAKEQWPWLASLDIESATTCLPGLNGPSTPRLGLKRFLDGENVRSIEFEAELNGFTVFPREARSALQRLFHGRLREDIQEPLQISRGTDGLSENEGHLRKPMSQSDS